MGFAVSPSKPEMTSFDRMITNIYEMQSDKWRHFEHSIIVLAWFMSHYCYKNVFRCNMINMTFHDNIYVLQSIQIYIMCSVQRICVVKWFGRLNV